MELNKYRDANVSVSPNGKYIFYVEEEIEENQDDQESKKSRKKRCKIVGRVSEIVTLRSKQDSVKISKLLKKIKTFKGQSFDQKVKETINVNDITFSLKPIRTISDIGNTLNLQKVQSDENSTKITVTDSGSVIIIDKENNTLLFNNIKVSDYVKGKLGINHHSKKKNEIKHMNWSFTSNGLIAFIEEDIYYLKVNEKRQRVEKVKKIDFKINKERLYIKDVNGWPNPKYILISLSTPYDELILIIWDVEENIEKYNYSLTGDFSYIMKPGTDFGVVSAW